MFGGHGLYGCDVFFAIVHRGKLFFRVDDALRADYEALGMKAFSPYGSEMRGYYEVPETIVEQAPEVVGWARRSIRTGRAQAMRRSSSV